MNEYTMQASQFFINWDGSIRYWMACSPDCSFYGTTRQELKNLVFSLIMDKKANRPEFQMEEK